MKITFISDLHRKHLEIENDLSSGDLLICSGDMTSRGSLSEIETFMKWFDKLDQYNHKVFISGNHDWGFQRNPKSIDEMLINYKNITYLEDSIVEIEGVKIWGSPWQPFFCDWAFNLFRMSPQLKSKWDLMPEDIDILITHGPPFGYLDTVENRTEHLGCELLMNRIEQVKPKINCFGHIHSGNGYVFNGETHFINSSVLNENYIYQYPPLTIEWDKETNNINF